jgi:hypothetical protein
MFTRNERIAAVAAALGTVAAIGLSVPAPASAGIGPAGFAVYARQGITSQDCRVYGGCGNSPWVTVCTDHPVYGAAPSDTVTCTVKEKTP